MTAETMQKVESAILCKIENLLSQEQTDAYYGEKDARALESYLRSLQILQQLKRGDENGSSGFRDR